jgi:hypothetical protein
VEVREVVRRFNYGITFCGCWRREGEEMDGHLQSSFCFHPCDLLHRRLKYVDALHTFCPYAKWGESARFGPADGDGIKKSLLLKIC